MEKSKETSESGIPTAGLGRNCKQIFLFFRDHLDTPLKSNMEPEKKYLEKEIPFGNHHFQVPC